MPKKKVDNLTSIFPQFSPLRIKYKDIFDLKAFYETLHEWFIEYGWKDVEEPGANGDHWENYYAEKIGSGGIREIWFQWRTSKGAPDSKYITYYMDLDVHCVGLGDTEVVRNGRKLKVNKGEIEMMIKFYLRNGYIADFNKHSFLRHFTDLFTKRIYASEIEQRKKELYQEAYVLQNFIKQWFKLKRFLPYEETKSFFPSSAYPSHIKE